MKYVRMPIEIESPEELGYDTINYNLAESSVTDAVLNDFNITLNHLKLQYTHHLGHPALRQLIADENELHQNNICLTAGAAAALFIVNTSLLEKEDHLIVLHPNYGTNYETPRAIGCQITYINLIFENKYVLNTDDIKKAIKPNTKLISITSPHNPTGVIINDDSINALIQICNEHSLYLLIDETYRDLCFTTKQNLVAYKSDRCISVSSLSKAYGMPGIRIGWIACKNEALNTIFLAAKEQIMLCNSVIDEEVAYQFYKNKEPFFIETMKQLTFKRKILLDWLDNEPHLEYIFPQGGVVVFPRVKNEFNFDSEKFYTLLYKNYKVLVGAGHWFEQTDRYFRLGFGWHTVPEFEKGLENMSLALKQCCVIK